MAAFIRVNTVAGWCVHACICVVHVGRCKHRHFVCKPLFLQNTIPSLSQVMPALLLMLLFKNLLVPFTTVLYTTVLK